MIKHKMVGVCSRKLTPKTDDRGWFVEVMRADDCEFEVKQTSYTVTHPGVIKAWHWHHYQADAWFVVKGRARAVLYDLRPSSPTYEQFEVVYIGEPNYTLLVIPPWVAHGYQVLGKEDFCMFYHTDKAYDRVNPDEQRIGFDALGFDWEVKNR